MQTLTRAVLDAGEGGRILRERQFRHWFEGTAQRRYNLVNRALQRGELIRLARGVYILHPDLAGSSPHPFVVAQVLRPGSFLSFESALAWHDCIPEAVPLHVSVVPGRRKAEFSVPLYGDFQFVPLPVRPGHGLVGVRRVQLTGGIGLVAEPLRALLDLACRRKVEPGEFGQFLAGLRLDASFLDDMEKDHLARYKDVYQHRRLKLVIDEFEKILESHD